MNWILLSEFFYWYIIYKNMQDRNKKKIELHVGNTHSLSSPVEVSPVLKVLRSNRVIGLVWRTVIL
jgi:hypothetical protein